MPGSGHLEGSQPIAAPRFDCWNRDFAHQPGDRNLAQVGVGKSGHRRVEHAGVGAEDRLDILGLNVLTPSDDGVVTPASTVSRLPSRRPRRRLQTIRSQALARSGR